jgi:hypothetical protein
VADAELLMNLRQFVRLVVIAAWTIFAGNGCSNSGAEQDTSCLCLVMRDRKLLLGLGVAVVAATIAFLQISSRDPVSIDGDSEPRAGLGVGTGAVVTLSSRSGREPFNT